MMGYFSQKTSMNSKFEKKIIASEIDIKIFFKSLNSLLSKLNLTKFSKIFFQFIPKYSLIVSKCLTAI